MFTPSMRADIVTVATLGAYCSPEVMVVTPSNGGFCQLLTGASFFFIRFKFLATVLLTESLLT